MTQSELFGISATLSFIAAYENIKTPICLPINKPHNIPRGTGFKSVPKKYVSGLKGSKRTARAKDIAKMQRLYKEGKKVPKSLFKRVFSWLSGH